MRSPYALARTLQYRCMLIIISSSSITLAVAQGTPPPTDVSPHPPSQPTTTAPTPPQQGWLWWDDTHGRDMNIAVDRMMELHAVDQRYRSPYEALGPTPWTNPGYQALTEQRNRELEGILSPEQYREYMRRTTPGTTPATPAAPTVPSTPK